MVKHYLSLTLRNVAKAPASALIAVTTLALGWVSFVGAGAVVEYWNRADRHFANSARTFVATTELAFRDGDGAGVVPRSTYWLAQYLEADFPQIDRIARVNPLNERFAVSNGRDRAARLRVQAADAAFLEIFDLPFVAGDSRAALASPASVVLTREAAATLFGGEPAVGQRVVLGGRIDATVTGVIGAIPEPSHMGRSVAAPLQFDVLASRDIYETSFDSEAGPDLAQTPENWFWLPVYTYVMLRDGASAAALRSELGAFAARHVPSEQIRNADYRLGLLPVTGVLGFAASGAAFIRETGLSASALLLAISALVLFAACLNYANLAIARSALRAREVGIRKAVGASRGQIVAQHLIEAAVATTVALCFAVAVVWLAAPLLATAVGIDVRETLLADSRSVGLLLGLDVLVTFVAAGYPALALARIPPDTILRSRTGGSSPRFLATVLVAGQFAAAGFLVIVMSVTLLQNEQLERRGLDSATDPLLVVENMTPLTGIDQRTLRDELRKVPQVVGTTSVLKPPWLPPNLISLARRPDTTAADERTATFAPVGVDFFSTYGIPLLAGREFAERYADEARAFRFDADPGAGAAPNVMIVDRRFAEILGFASPAAAIGQVVYAPRTTPFEIVGVAENKPLSLTGDGSAGNAYVFSPSLSFHLVRVDGSQLEQGLAGIDALLRARAPAAPINRRFVDDYFRDGYLTFARVGKAFTLLAGAALAIAIMGLAGMAIHMASRRLREIGVRKALGATTSAIAALLLQSLSRPILIGTLLSWPLAHFAVERYLSVFSEPIDPSPLLYVYALVSVLVIGWLAIGGQTLRAARRKPAEVLRED